MEKGVYVERSIKERSFLNTNYDMGLLPTWMLEEYKKPNGENKNRLNNYFIIIENKVRSNDYSRGIFKLKRGE